MSFNARFNDKINHYNQTKQNVLIFGASTRDVVQRVGSIAITKAVSYGLFPLPSQGTTTIITGRHARPLFE